MWQRVHLTLCMCVVLTRSSLVVSSFGIQLHPQSTRPPSHSQHEQNTCADSGCGARHSEETKSEKRQKESPRINQLLLHFHCLIFNLTLRFQVLFCFNFPWTLFAETIIHFFFKFSIKISRPPFLPHKCSKRDEEPHFALMHRLIEITVKHFLNLSRKVMNLISTTTGLIVLMFPDDCC